MIPLHPQACPGDPQRLRWIAPPDVIPFTGLTGTVPPVLAELVEDGTVAEVQLEAQAVVIRLGPEHHWPAAGPRVRSAVHTALTHPDQWAHSAPDRPAPDGGDHDKATEPFVGTTSRDRDTELGKATRRLLDGDVGPIAASHGGRIELVAVRDGIVRLRLGGACHDCPTSSLTVQRRLEAGLRGRPGYRGIVTEASRPSWRLLRRRR